MEVVEELDTQGLTGYDTHDRYFASRFIQGGRPVFSLDLPLAMVALTLPRPDPDRPTPGNRIVDAKHAADFGSYVREKKDWVSPALMLRAPDVFEFEKKAEVNGARFGVLGVPRDARADLRILDGQHRILGLHLASEAIASELEEKRRLAASARRNGETAEVIELLESEIAKLQGQRTRLSNERISVQIIIEDEQEAYQQMFVDIAENAKGITKTLQSRFDTRKVVNRALAEVVKHPLLEDRVELQLDRVKSDSQLLAARHVADIIRAIAVGMGHRISRVREEELDQRWLVRRSNQFFNVLVQSFPILKEIEAGTEHPGRLRKTSLLGSATFLRVLAGVYHDLTDKDAATPMSDDDVVDFFGSLIPHLDLPVTESLWLDTEVFEPNASAPKARGGDMYRLGKLIGGWARDGLPTAAAA